MGKQVEDQVRAHQVAGIDHQPPPLANPPPPPNAIRFKGAVLSEVEELKLLGVTFDRQLAFRSHIRQLAVRGAQRLGFLRKASAVLDPKHRAIEYRGFVRPVLVYGMLVWMSAAPTTLARLTAIQLPLHNCSGSYLPSRPYQGSAFCTSCTLRKW